MTLVAKDAELFYIVIFHFVVTNFEKIYDILLYLKGDVPLSVHRNIAVHNRTKYNYVFLNRGLA